MNCHHYCNCELDCPECVKRFWKWAQTHTMGRGKRGAKVATADTFYEAAARWPNQFTGQ
jgi:hypothetical protein